MCLVFCGDYIIPYIGSVLLFYFGFSIKKLEFLGVRSLSPMFIIPLPTAHVKDVDGAVMLVLNQPASVSKECHA